MLTGETPESLYEGKLVTCTVVGIVRRKPLQETLERANPIQDKNTHLWQCPICLAPDFRDVGLVWQHLDGESCPGQSFGVRTRLENGLSGFILAKNISDKPVSSPEDRVHVSTATLPGKKLVHSNHSPVSRQEVVQNEDHYRGKKLVHAHLVIVI